MKFFGVIMDTGSNLPLSKLKICYQIWNSLIFTLTWMTAINQTSNKKKAMEICNFSFFPLPSNRGKNGKVVKTQVLFIF